jgi:membrane associated rhomboid family serine protease
MSFPYPPQTPTGAPTCYRHPERQTLVSCNRCGRPTCPECMRSAAVGHQCVDCVQAAAQNAPTAVTVSGGVRRAGAPVLTYALIAVNVAVFVLQAVTPGLQGKLALWAPAVAGGELYRLGTSAFIHYGLLHLLFNMGALYVVGPPLERHLGRLRFAALYALSALGGSVVVYLFSPLNSATGGASGAVFGLFGATFVLAKRLNLDVRGVVTLIAINMAITFTIPGISWQGHVGGLVTGGLIAAAYLYAPRAGRNLVQGGATMGLLALFVGLIAWRTTSLVDRFGPMLNHR